jgi:ATP-binding cassette, subfamily B, bacterial IrtA/YbtP
MKKKEGPYKRLFTYAGGFRYLTYASVVLSACSAVLALIPYIYIWNIVKEVLYVMPDYSAAVNIGSNGIAAVLFSLISIIVYIAALMCSHIAAFRIARNIRSTAVHHVVSLPDGCLDRMGSGKMRRIIDQSSSATETFLAHRTPDKAGAVVTPVAILVLLFMFDWRFGIASLVPVLAAFAVMSAMTGKRMKESMKQYTDALEDMSNETVEYVRGVAVIKTFGQTAFSFSRLKNSVERYSSWVVRYTNALRRPMLAFTLLVYSVFAFLIAGAFIFSGGMPATSGFLAGFLFYVIFTPVIPVTLMKIMFASEDTMKVKDAMDRIDSLLSLKPLPTASADHIRTPESFDIRVSCVGFTYEGNSGPALSNVSISASTGKTIALVGPSGGGKTTLASLIARAWDPDYGTITIGGIDIRCIRKDVLMRTVSCVFQDTSLFKTSILENVRLGRPDATRSQVLAALHAAQCDDILRKFPLGVDTVFGSKGTYFSGGECQRIALARVVLNDTPIVILDEATAFADPENEYLMQRAFSELSAGRTVIKIAHRLSTVRNADRIYVLEDGSIRESGTHEQLLQNGTLYPKMWAEYCKAAEWHV